MGCKVLFRLFWGSLGFVLGAFGAFLGAPFVYEQVRGGHLNFRIFFGGTFEPPSWAPRNLRYIHVCTRSRPGGSDGSTELPKSRIHAFLRVILYPRGLITRKNAGILLLGGFLGPLPRHEGVNHTYFTYDCALWRLQLADGGPSFRAQSLHFYVLS